MRPVGFAPHPTACYGSGMTSNNDILREAAQIARDAGDLLRVEHSKPRQITHKGRVDLVTQADSAAEELIVKRLGAAFPEHTIIAEEGGGQASNSGLTWYVDPLDGTNNFAHGFPHFCVSIGLADGASPLLGVIYDPLRDELFSAVRGEGATLNGAPLTVSEVQPLREALVMTGFPYDRHTAEDNNTEVVSRFVRKALGTRRSGSAALDMAYVAAGRLDGYWEQGLRAWDAAVGVLLVQEAGGQTSEYTGGPFELGPGLLRAVCSNGLIHAEMLAVLAEFYAAGGKFA